VPRWIRDGDRTTGVGSLSDASFEIISNLLDEI